MSSFFFMITHARSGCSASIHRRQAGHRMASSSRLFGSAPLGLTHLLMVWPFVASHATLLTAILFLLVQPASVARRNSAYSSVPGHPAPRIVSAGCLHAVPSVTGGADTCVRADIDPDLDLCKLRLLIRHLVPPFLCNRYLYAEARWCTAAIRACPPSQAPLRMEAPSGRERTVPGQDGMPLRADTRSRQT